MNGAPALWIGGRLLRAGEPLFAIAELGLNHGGDPDRALALVDAAAAAGASAVKLQTFRAERLVAPGCPAPAHVAAASLEAFFRRFELDAAAHRAVVERARRAGLACLSTPFDEEAVDLLVRLGMDALKIASGDITHHRLIARAARTGLPLIVSTGMSTAADVAAALDVAYTAGARGRVALLHCVSCYPVPDGHDNLAAIATLARTFGVPVGLSDHGGEPLAAALTVALGGSLWERHLVATTGDGGVDAAVSSTPEEFAARLALAERARRALGHGRKECLGVEAVNVAASRRGLYAARALAAGERLGEADLVCLRPVAGLPADRWGAVAGRRLARPVAAGAPLVEADLAAEPGETPSGWTVCGREPSSGNATAPTTGAGARARARPPGEAREGVSGAAFAAPAECRQPPSEASCRSSTSS
jgi:sialic acid synthase SpsE